MKFLSMRAELFHRMDGRKDVRTDRERQTDMTKLIVVFRKFSNARKDEGYVMNGWWELKEIFFLKGGTFVDIQFE